MADLNLRVRKNTGGVGDLHPRSVVTAGRPAPQRTAVFGAVQPRSDRLLHHFRAGFPCPAAGALSACADRGSHEAGGAAAPGSVGGDPPAWPTTRLFPLIRGRRAGSKKSLCMAL